MSPTYNHTRGDSALAPCEVCAATPVEKNMANIIGMLEGEESGLRERLEAAEAEAKAARELYVEERGITADLRRDYAECSRLLADARAQLATVTRERDEARAERDDARESTSRVMADGWRTVRSLERQLTAAEARAAEARRLLIKERDNCCPADDDGTWDECSDCKAISAWIGDRASASPVVAPGPTGEMGKPTWCNCDLGTAADNWQHRKDCNRYGLDLDWEPAPAAPVAVPPAPECLRTLTPEELAKVKPLTSDEIAAALERGARDKAAAEGRPWPVPGTGEALGPLGPGDSTTPAGNVYGTPTPAPSVEPAATMVSADVIERSVLRWRAHAKRRTSDIGLDQALLGAFKDGMAASNVARQLGIPDDWQPTAENVNRLPAPLFRYVAGIETNADPGGMVRENVLLRDRVAALEVAVAPATPAEPVREVRPATREQPCGLCGVPMGEGECSRLVCRNPNGSQTDAETWLRERGWVPDGNAWRLMVGRRVRIYSFDEACKFQRRSDRAKAITADRSSRGGAP